MDKGDKRIDDFEKVLYLTHCKKDVVSMWARRGVQSEACMNMAYLKRRIKTIWPERHKVAIRADIKCIIKYIKRLKPIADTIGEMIL